EAASNVVARVRSQVPAKTKTRIGDDELLEAPLPPEDDEGDALDGKSTTGDVRDRNSGSIPAASSGKVLEGGRMTMSSDQRQRERSSFKDLAKLAATPPPSSAGGPTSSKGDSGVVDLKSLQQSDPYAAERAQSTRLASRGIFDDDVAGPAAARPPSVPP